jgi:hypothetical protein
MPLPISAQTYIHNPLTEAKATEIGKGVGSPFANFAEGLLSGVERGVDVAGKIQALELAPLEQERKNKATELAERESDLNQVKEDRLANNQEFEQDYKKKELEIKRLDLKRKQDLTTSQISNNNTRAAINSQNQARSNLVQGSLDELFTRGNVDSIVGILEDRTPGAPRLRDDLRNKVIKDYPETAEKLEEMIGAGKVSTESAARIQSFLGTLDHVKNIQVAERINEKDAVPLYLKHLKVVPDDNDFVDILKDDGNYKFIAKDSKGIEKLIGVLPAETDLQTLFLLHQANNAHNNVVRQRRALTKSVEQVAEAKAMRDQLPNDQEGLTRRAREPFRPLPRTTRQAVDIGPSEKSTERIAINRTGTNNVKATGDGEVLPKKLSPEEEAKRKKAMRELTNRDARMLRNRGLTGESKKHRVVGSLDSLFSPFRME